MVKFKNKYRISTTRLHSWDYSWNAVYFVTICTHNKEHFFGRILSGEMVLSEIGQIADEFWKDIPQHFPFVKLGEYIIMPNHIHGLVRIDKVIEDNSTTVETQYSVSQKQNIALENNNDVTPGHIFGINESQDIVALHPYSLTMNKFGPQSGNLASIIRGFKSGVTKKARKIDPLFRWQPRYFDHIVRNNNDFDNITRYIIDNPENWNEDELF